MNFRSSGTTLVPARFRVLALGVLFAAAGAVTPIAAACLTTGRVCGPSTVVNDRLCCPGTICGPWGNVCQPGCRIGGIAYRSGTSNPANPCQVCRPSASTTRWTNVPNGTACSDANACTVADTCNNGSCLPGAARDCNDGNPCTDDDCDPATGCVNTPDPTNTCADADLCTDEACSATGACISTTRDCDDNNDCTDDSCDPASGCASTPDDDNTCGEPTSCTGYLCKFGTCVDFPVSCDDLVTCTEDSCDSTVGCVHAPNDASCDDGRACTTDSCDPAAGCQHVVSAAACEQIRLSNDCIACAISHTANLPTCVAIIGGASSCNNAADVAACASELNAAGCFDACCGSVAP